MPHPRTNFLYDYYPVKLWALENGGEKNVCGCVSGCIDYHSFGMTIPGKSWTASGTGYRYAFNGKEIDTIGMGGGGSTYDYGFRIYNAQIAKFLSVDPLTKDYPWYTPYQFAGNKPIENIDLDGLEEYSVKYHTYNTALGNTVVHTIDYQYIRLFMRNQFMTGIGTGFQERDDVLNITYSNNYFVGLRGNDTRFFNIENSFYNEIKSNHQQNQRPTGTVFVYYQSALFYAEDQGRTVEQVTAVFNTLSAQQQQHIDGMICILANNPEVRMEVVGYASSRPTNIGRENEETTTQNNVQLSERRAMAGAEFIIAWAQQNYGVDISSQIITSSGVRDSDPSTNNSQTDRTVEFNLTR